MSQVDYIMIGLGIILVSVGVKLRQNTEEKQSFLGFYFDSCIAQKNEMLKIGKKYCMGVG